MQKNEQSNKGTLSASWFSMSLYSLAGPDEDFSLTTSKEDVWYGAVVMPMNQTAQRSWFESSNKRADTSSWSENLMGAVQRTVIISEILDSRTRHLIQAIHGSHYMTADFQVRSLSFTRAICRFTISRRIVLSSCRVLALLSVSPTLCMHYQLADEKY